MAHEHTADFNVMPLFGFGPPPALRLVELVQKRENPLVAVVPQSVFEGVLVEVESMDRVGSIGGGTLLPNSLEK